TLNHRPRLCRTTSMTSFSRLLERSGFRDRAVLHSARDASQNGPRRRRQTLAVVACLERSLQLKCSEGGFARFGRKVVEGRGELNRAVGVALAVCGEQLLGQRIFVH